jgi:hypothetical protein
MRDAAPFYPLPAGLGKRASLRSSSRGRRSEFATHARIPQRNRATPIALVMRERAQRNHLFARADASRACGEAGFSSYSSNAARGARLNIVLPILKAGALSCSTNV